MHIFTILILILALTSCQRTQEGFERGFVEYNVKDDSYTSIHPSSAFGDIPCQVLTPEEEQELQYLAYGEIGTTQVNGLSPDETAQIIGFSYEMSRQHHLRLENSLIFYDVAIESIMLDYTSMALVEFCPARHVAVDVVEGFLSRINNDPKVAAKLLDGPFTPEDLEIYITYESFYGVHVNPPALVRRIIVQNGIVYYYTFEELDSDIDAYKCRVEPYAKTLEIARVERELLQQLEKAYKPPERKLFETRIYLTPPPTVRGGGPGYPPIPGGYPPAPGGYPYYPPQPAYQQNIQQVIVPPAPPAPASTIPVVPIPVTPATTPAAEPSPAPAPLPAPEPLPATPPTPVTPTTPSTTPLVTPPTITPTPVTPTLPP